MLEPEVFRKQMCCIEESTGDIVGIFQRPSAVIWRPIVIRRPGDCVPPLLRPWLCSTWLKPCSATYVVCNTSSNKANFRKTLTALDTSLTIRVNKIWHRLDHRFGSRWNGLDVESHSLMSVNRQTGTSPCHFLCNPTFGVISTTERLRSMPQIKGGEKDIMKFLVQPTCRWLDLLAGLSFPFPSPLYWYTLSLVRMNTKQLYP